MSEPISVRVTDLHGETHAFEGQEGYSLMEIIRDNGLPMKAECGGCLCCATCAVEVAPGWLPQLGAASPDEKDLMEDAGLNVTPQTRLSCQIVLAPALDGVAVKLVPAP